MSTPPDVTRAEVVAATERRMIEIRSGIERRKAAGEDIPDKWVQEYSNLYMWLTLNNPASVQEETP